VHVVVVVVGSGGIGGSGASSPHFFVCNLFHV